MHPRGNSRYSGHVNGGLAFCVTVLDNSHISYLKLSWPEFSSWSRNSLNLPAWNQLLLTMAEAIGVGSGILAFLTVSVKLTTVLYSVWDDFREAPAEIRDIAHRIDQLSFYLKQVLAEEQDLTAMGPTCQSNREFTDIWMLLHVRLREVTTEFLDFGGRLKKKNDSREIWSRTDWVIRNKKRTLEFDRKISSHLESFKTIWNLITHGNVKKLGVQQRQLFDDMSRKLVAQSQQTSELDSSQNAHHMELHLSLRSIEALTRRSTAEIQSTLTAVTASQKILSFKVDSLEQTISCIAPNNSEPIYTTVSTTRSIVRKPVFVCFKSWNNYRLPIGHLQVFTGSKNVEGGSKAGGAGGWSFGVQFEFFPAPWLSNKSIVAYVRYYQNGSGMPVYLPRMYCSATVSANRQACRAVENDDVNLLKSLFSSHLAMPHDRDEHGWTLLHKAARWRQPEICNFLISEHADLNATDIWGRTPLHVACDYGVSQTAILLMERASDLSSPVISAAMRAYATLPSIFNRAINLMFYRLFEDFTGFEEMAPTVTATILCFQLSGAFQLQPKELRSWLLSHRPKDLDSAMPTQSLISDHLRTMFSRFSKGQMGNMDTAVRHSCTVKSETLFRLLSDCGVINNLPENEILFSLGIASENGNLIPLRTLMSIKITLQKLSGIDDRLLYQGRPELVKSILDEKTFNKSPPKVTNIAPTGPRSLGAGITPLMRAAINDDIKILRYLIETGADVQAVDWQGRTALDHAMTSDRDGSGAIVELLQTVQGKPELERLPALATGHVLSHDPSEGRRSTGAWVHVTQIYAIILGWWKYLRQFALSDVLLVISGLVVVSLGSVWYTMVPWMIGFLLQHRGSIKKWFKYLVVGYSMYLVGKYRN